jgi:hypothetical protein
MKNECKSCDHCVESKQGVKCFNPKSDNFNKKVDLKDSCVHIEFNYYAHPKGSE